MVNWPRNSASSEKSNRCAHSTRPPNQAPSSKGSFSFSITFFWALTLPHIWDWTGKGLAGTLRIRFRSSYCNSALRCCTMRMVSCTPHSTTLVWLYIRHAQQACYCRPYIFRISFALQSYYLCDVCDVRHSRLTTHYDSHFAICFFHNYTNITRLQHF